MRGKRQGEHVIPPKESAHRESGIAKSQAEKAQSRDDKVDRSIALCDLFGSCHIPVGNLLVFATGCCDRSLCCRVWLDRSRAYASMSLGC